MYPPRGSAAVPAAVRRASSPAEELDALGTTRQDAGASMPALRCPQH
jgi:hypothetical protein